MKFKKILKITAIFFIVFTIVFSTGLYFTFDRLVAVFNKNLFNYILNTLNNEINDVDVTVREYKFDWKNRKINFIGISISGDAGVNGYVESIILHLNYSDFKYPVERAVVSNGVIHTIIHSIDLFEKLKKLSVEPPSAAESFYVKNIELRNFNFNCYDKFTDVKYKLTGLNTDLSFKNTAIERIRLDSGAFSFFILNKGALAFLKEQKIEIDGSAEHIFFEDMIFEYDSAYDTPQYKPSLYKLVLRNNDALLKIEQTEPQRMLFEALNINIPLPKTPIKLAFLYDCRLPDFEGRGQIKIEDSVYNILFENNVLKLSEKQIDYFVYDFEKQSGISLKINQLQLDRYFHKIKGALGFKFDLNKVNKLYSVAFKLNARNIEYEKIKCSGAIDAVINFLEKDKLKPLRVLLKSNNFSVNNEKIKFDIDCIYQNYDISLNRFYIAPVKPFSVYDNTIVYYFDADTGIFELSPKQIKLLSEARITNLLDKNKVTFVYNIDSDSFLFDYEFNKFNFSGAGQLENQKINFGFSAEYENKSVAAINGFYDLYKEILLFESRANSPVKFKFKFAGFNNIDFNAEITEIFMRNIGYSKELVSFNSYLDLTIRDKIIYKLKLLYSEKAGAKFIGYIDGVDENVNIEKIVYEFPDAMGTLTVAGKLNGDIVAKKCSINLKTYFNDVKSGFMKVTGNVGITADLNLINNEYSGVIKSNDLEINNTQINNITIAGNYINDILILKPIAQKGFSFSGKIENKNEVINIDDFKIINDTAEIAVITGKYDKRTTAINLKYKHYDGNLSNLAVYSDFITKIDGNGEFSLEIMNKLTDPVINADLIFNKVNINLAEYVRELKNLTGAIKIRNNNLYFDNVRVENFRGAIVITSDTGSNLNNLNLNVSASKIKVEIPEVEMSGQADINGKLIGSIKKPVFKGNAYVSNAQFTYPPLKPQKAAKIDTSAVYPFWDATVHIRENVWYRYPLIDVELDKGNSMQFYGTKLDLFVRGYLSSRNGKLTYLSQRFNLNFAEMNVNSEAGVPIVTGEAETIIDNIEIKLNYSGPVDKFKPVFRAPLRPELTEEEVNKIIRLGTTGNLTQTQRNVTTDDDYSAAKFVDKNLGSMLLRPIEQKLMSDFNLFVNINAPVFENILRRDGASDTDVSARNLLLNTSFSIGRYLARDLYLEYRGQFVNTLDSNDINGGYRTGLKSEIEAKYNLDRQTFLRYKWTPSLERDKQSEHFIMLEKRFRY